MSFHRPSKPRGRPWGPAGRAVAGLAAALALSGCGYRLVTADGGGPVPVLRLGVLNDDTAQGDLGLRVRARLERALAARERPRVAAPGADAPRLEGTIEALPDRTIAFEPGGAAFQVRLRGRLRLEAEPPVAWPLWTSGDVDRAAVYPRGPTAATTEANRRLALEAAADALADALLERIVESPEVRP